eukprot:scaffold30105_cov30-Phaeocystis_antarctica.AAC.1
MRPQKISHNGSEVIARGPEYRGQEWEVLGVRARGKAPTPFLSTHTAHYTRTSLGVGFSTGVGVLGIQRRRQGRGCVARNKYGWEKDTQRAATPARLLRDSSTTLQLQRLTSEEAPPKRLTEAPRHLTHHLLPPPPSGPAHDEAHRLTYPATARAPAAPPSPRRRPGRSRGGGRTRPASPPAPGSPSATPPPARASWPR